MELDKISIQKQLTFICLHCLGKHQDSRENKTNRFSEGSDIKCFVLDFHFNSNKRIIGANQNSLLGTYTALLEATDSCAFNTDRGNVNAVVFLDLKKAFDTVDHDVLLAKLSLYVPGIQESAYDLF